MKNLTHACLAYGFAKKFRGVHRLNSLLNKGGEVVTSNKYNVKMSLDPFGYIDSNVLREGYYESEIIEAILRTTNSDSFVFWDIGSNFGLHAITIKSLMPNCSVYSFEPIPELADRIKNGASLNGIEIEINNFALSNSSGPAEFHVASAGNLGVSSLNPWPDVQYTRKIEVQKKRADELISGTGIPLPTIMKIDVEGHELNVLEGFGDYLCDPKLRAVIFEFSDDLLKATTPHPIRSILESSGFQISCLEREEQTVHTHFNFLGLKP